MRTLGNTNCSTLRFVRTEASQSRSFVLSVENSVEVPLCISGFAVRLFSCLVYEFLRLI